ncbi:hypothetical protein KR032_010580 [Drosophila birchii]|nr:hypothetical protein KR032_010580 [Drosophila birchii]
MNPAVDAWAVTQRERVKYQEQFKALQPQAGFVTGAQAKGFFLQSQLPPLILGQIWALADTDSDGKMNINEFSIACKLINLKLRGMEVPKVLPPSLLASLSGDGVKTPSMTPRGSTSSMSPMDPLKGIVPAVAPAPVVAAAPPIAAATVISPPGVVEAKLPAGPTPPSSNPPSRHMSVSERAPSIESLQQGGDWAVQAAQKRKYTQVFNANDRTRSGFLTGAQARGVLVQSKLPQVTLAQIWTLSDIDGDGRLSCDEFILAMFLCEKAMGGEKIPVTLPQDWVPPNLRKIKSRPGSVSGVVSRPGSQPASRHASVSSQGGVAGAVDADPAAGLPGQTSFEDKRKENYVKGQAELDRRRKVMEDQQRKEREERERKEREEIEKREKARLEAERKQQEELERQLQRQREIELEKEEQRKRELEAKEAARKELEKQRQQEWEQARIAEMNAQKQREQERVLKQKAHNTQLNVELSTLNEKIKDLSQKICDTRAGVTNVKTVIDGMRTQRDTSMSEMAQLKARIKEQNAKLLQLTQERAKWDAKSKASNAAMGGENAQQEQQLNAAFAHKQLLIKQIKDKVENIGKEIESKKEDINSNDIQMTELKAELSALLNKCEELYKEYDVERTSVLELKYNRKNESSTSSAWDTGASSGWGEPETVATDPYAGLSNDIGAVTAPAADLSGPAPEGFAKYRAVYEFNARNAEEITFVPGDIILVPLEQNAEPGWLAGEINGHTGWFPESYVEKLDDGEVTSTIAAAVEPEVVAQTASVVADTYNDNINAAAEPAADLTAAGDVEYYIAAYPYESAEDGDLSFGAGEMVMVIKKEGEWWTGTIGNRTGMFPSNYVQKADVGTANTAAAAAVTSAASEAALNGNAAAYASAAPVEQHEQQQQQQFQPLPVQELSEQPGSGSGTGVGAGAEEAPEDLDTEVSQINTQSKTQSSEPAESYSRPMSRTSSMTPGMRAKRSEIAQVIAPYEATSTEQLSLTRGQLIMIRKKTDSGWWEGELQAKGRRRQIGWFPATYVKVLQGGRNSGRNTPVSGSRIEMTEQILDKVIALYPYKAQNDDELSFDKDDIISVLGRDEPEWWRGELNGLSGLFPSNYVGPFVTSDSHSSFGERKANRIQRLWHQWRGYQAEPGEDKLQGTIQAVHIGRRSDGQLMGCAYFRFECTEEMAQSMLQDEDNRLVGRSVLADWQLPKKRHISCCW